MIHLCSSRKALRRLHSLGPDCKPKMSLVVPARKAHVLYLSVLCQEVVVQCLGREAQQGDRSRRVPARLLIARRPRWYWTHCPRSSRGAPVLCLLVVCIEASAVKDFHQLFLVRLSPWCIYTTHSLCARGFWRACDRKPRGQSLFTLGQCVYASCLHQCNYGIN